MNSPDSISSECRALTRREAMRQIFVAAALASQLDLTSFGQGQDGELGWDPHLLKKEIPWPRVLTSAEKQTVAVLADLIIPADEYGPAASAVGVPDFIDEWVSAPYDQQRGDLKTIREGLAWFDTEAKRRFGKIYAEATAAEQIKLLDLVLVEGSPERKAGYSFFKLFRDRAAGGYYSTAEGWKALGTPGTCLN